MSVAGDQKLDRKNGRAAGRAGAVGYQTDWRGYVNRELTPSEKEQFEDWYVTEEQWDILEEVLRDGVQVSVKADGFGSGFLASATQRTPGHVNAGLAVTARSSHAWKAQTRLLYILHLIGPKSDWAATSKPADPDRW